MRKPDQRNKRRPFPPDSRRGGPRDSERRAEAHPERAPDPRVVYGLLPVLESLRAGARRVEKILIAEGAKEKRITEIIELARSRGIHFQKVPRDILTRAVGAGANHQGVVAYAASADYADAEDLLDEIAARPQPLALILDGVEDPRNLGAILRVAECAGADGVFIPEHRAVGLTETVVKTAAGATEYVRIAKVKNLNRLIEQLKEHNIWVVGASGDARSDHSEWDWNQPCALVMGSEGKGLHRLVAENCDVLVRIPMQGNIDSLNVSVAAGVILFEAVRQRQKALKTRESQKPEEA